MTDIVPPKIRSRMMSGIRAKNTNPEMIIRRGLHALGFRFRLHAKGLIGKPDLVLRKYGAIIFVHGCFWHAHDCDLFKMPSTRTEFWEAKFDRNKKRDAEVSYTLKNEGWRILTIWECAFRGNSCKDTSEVFHEVSNWLEYGGLCNCEIRGN